MADETPRRSGITKRAHTIMNMINHEAPSDSHIIVSYHGSDQRLNKPLQPSSEERDLVNQLNSRPYSMTSGIFNNYNFCETQTTYSSHHVADLPNIIDTLKALVTENNNTIENEKPSTSSELTLGTKNVSPECTMDLMCNESLTDNVTSPMIVPMSPLDTTQQDRQLDFSSDDSVADKNYSPSECSDSEDEAISLRQKPIKKPTNKPTLLCRKQQNTITTDIMISSDVSNSDQPTLLRRKRRNTITTTDIMISSDVSNSDQPTALCRKRRNTINTDIIISSDVSNSDLERPITQPKRKKHDSSLTERKAINNRNKRLKHSVKEGCNLKCYKKCKTHFNTEERESINNDYWNLSWREQHLFIRSICVTATPKRRSTSEPKRKPRRNFFLTKNDGTQVAVCKIFLLTTLGFDRKNDSILRSFLQEEAAAIRDKRGKHRKTLPFDRKLLTDHIESFCPTEHHYRREHAPLRRYIPSDINVAMMHKHFSQTHPDKKISYELYRRQIKQMKISFTRLGNEECESCETHNLHVKETSHNADDEIDCNVCVGWLKHRARYTKARELYNVHKAIVKNESQIYFSGDLEKVIMLPRLESFKTVIFCHRLTAFNQTFAPLGKITNESKPMTIIWNDSVAGRKQQDIMSAFYHFILRYRDMTNINIWLDNCTAQNKNWLLFSMLVHLVNSNLISTLTISLFYFEPGHTFMSADQVHHQVELAMKRKQKLYNFDDFEDAVASINNSRVLVKAMEYQNFIDIPNYISDRRIQNTQPRPYLKNMVQVNFERGNFDLIYRNNFDDEPLTLRFMNDKYLRNPLILNVTFRTKPKGIDIARKLEIIEKLAPIIPKNKMLFWENLPVEENDEQPEQTKKRVK